ncbi:MAG: hypothetical protein NVSMB9_03420 [Isosphaeraceae bacterium]
MILLSLARAAPPDVPQARDGSRGAVEVPALNRKVLAFAREHLGRKVANGECTSLAIEAYRSAGARRFRLDGRDGNYVWGRPVASFRESIPGDVVQFRDAVYRGKTRLPRGRWRSWRESYPHHTAVIADVREEGRRITLLHQNIGPEDATDAEKKVVRETTLRSDSLQKGGQVWIYRPIPLEEPESSRAAPP